jgi:hypothetical protein
MNQFFKGFSFQSSIYDTKDAKPDEQDHDIDTHNDEAFEMFVKYGR